MSELKLTQARLELLRAIADGEVNRSRFFPYKDTWGPRQKPPRWLVVSARVRQLYEAGLVEPRSSNGVLMLTDFGRAALPDVADSAPPVPPPGAAQSLPPRD